MKTQRFYLDSLILFVPRTGLEPVQLLSQGIFVLLLLLYKPSPKRCCSLDYFFTMSYDLGVACIVSTPFINHKWYFFQNFALYKLAIQLLYRLNLVSHRQIRCHQRKGFCLLGQFYFISFPMSTLFFKSLVSTDSTIWAFR